MKLLKILFIISILNFFLLLGLGLINQTRILPSSDLPSTKPVESLSNLPKTCIITIDGTKYDVTIFRNIHSGGDIFACGTDMSAVFHQQHNLNVLKKISNLLIK